MAKRVKPKKRCCGSRPRCRRCAVVLERLESAGLAERDRKGRFRLEPDIPKKRLKQARRR